MLLLCSHFSPIYQYNFSNDPSIYLTIGRGINRGLIPYKNLLDIKGPIIFFLYGLFSPLKLGTNYIGIFILEAIALLISVTYLYKTIVLVSKSSKFAFLLTLLYPFVLLNLDSFNAGGEAEEFILPFIFVLIYYTFKLIQQKFELSKAAFFMQGLLLSIVFWIKYTTIGAWVAFYLCLLIIYIYRKNFHALKNMILYSFLGFLIPTAIVCGYFGINYALDDLIWGYFGWNFKYGGTTNKGIFQQLFFMVFHGFTIFLKRNPIIWLLAIAGPYIAIFSNKLTKKKSVKIMLILMTFGSIGLEFFGGIMYSYYQLMAIPFITLTFCMIAVILKQKMSQISGKLALVGVTIIVVLGVLIVNPSYKQSNLTGYTPHQERFAKIITKNDKTPTVLDFNELDHGWYNYLNIMPPTKYFNKMNFHHKGEYQPYTNAQLKLVKNKKVEYIIMPISHKQMDNRFNRIVRKNYKVIASQNVQDVNTYKMELLQRK